MASSHYITLPASSSADFFPNNTNSHYFTKLDQRLNLKDGTWEVAIADLQYPVSWATLTDGEIEITETIPNKSIHTMELKSGRPDSPYELILRLNLMFRVKGVGELVRSFYDSFKNQVLFDIKEGVTMKMSANLCDILGFERGKIFSKGIYKSERPVDIDGGFHSIYIYSDLIERRAVGDRQVPLLQIVLTEGKRNQTVHVPFLNRQYQKAAAVDGEIVEIRLTKDDGTDIPFTSGRVSITLHVRKRI